MYYLTEKAVDFPKGRNTVFVISKKTFLNEAKLGTADLKLITRVMHAREKILKDFSASHLSR